MTTKLNNIKDNILKQKAKRKKFGGRPNLMALRRAQNKAYYTLFNLKELI